MTRWWAWVPGALAQPTGLWWFSDISHQTSVGPFTLWCILFVRSPSPTHPRGAVSLQRRQILMELHIESYIVLFNRTILGSLENSQNMNIVIPLPIFLSKHDTSISNVLHFICWENLWWLISPTKQHSIRFSTTQKWRLWNWRSRGGRRCHLWSFQFNICLKVAGLKVTQN